MNNSDQYFTRDCETATVIAVKDRWVSVELEEKDGCHECGAKMICRPNATGKRTLKMLNTIGAKVGDQVLIEQIGANQFKLTLIQYGLPLVGFLAGILISNHYIKHSLWGVPAEIMQMFCGTGMVVMVGFGIYFWSRRQARSEFNVFRLRKIINSKTE